MEIFELFTFVSSLGFRLVYDRETGKPKGYGFCEYQDQETALSAMRNLNGREFSGRALRVDNAASEKNKEELKSKLILFVFNRGGIMLVLMLWFCRFGDRSSYHRVPIWRQCPSRGGPRVHQQSCGQSAAWADVWTHETDEGEFFLGKCLWRILFRNYILFMIMGRLMSLFVSILKNNMGAKSKTSTEECLHWSTLQNRKKQNHIKTH